MIFATRLQTLFTIKIILVNKLSIINKIYLKCIETINYLNQREFINLFFKDLFIKIQYKNHIKFNKMCR